MGDASGSVIALLNLPVGSIVCLDGEQVALRTDDFVGFSSVPQRDGFHFATATSSAGNQGRNEGTTVGVTTGLILFPNEGEHIIRAYDPLTEELSSNLVDPRTQANLLGQIGQSQISPHRLVHYSHFVKETQSARWKSLTSFVSESFLKSHHNLHSGDKIVPSTLDDPNQPPPSSGATPSIVDGVAVSFPNIPIINAIRSARHSEHMGTKLFLASLSAPKRSELFLHAHPSDLALDLTLEVYYGSNWRLLLADLQLSYILFVYLHCFASLQFWRDVIVLMSLPDNVRERRELYSCFLEILLHQFTSDDRDFFDGMDMSSDRDLPLAVHRLTTKLSDIQDPHISELVLKLNPTLDFVLPLVDEGTAGFVERVMDVQDAEDDDEPTIVSGDEIQSSLRRIASSPKGSYQSSPPEEIQKDYPLLVAAMAPTEDIIMTCARALEQCNDVSLVREAAQYLEHVEANCKKG